VSTARVATVPNVISLARLVCVPLFLWLLWGPEERVAAAVLLGALGATDWVDGYVARRYDQGSDVGRVLDPTADRALLVAGAAGLLAEDLGGGVDVVLWTVLARETLIAIATVGLALAGARRIDVVWAGKAGTLALMFALPAFLLADTASVDALEAALAAAGWCFAAAGVALGYYAAVRYVPQARDALREGRAARAGAEVQG
jgi:cardiolipin synthase